MTKEELDFIGSMNMCDEISNEAYKKIVSHVEETEISDDCVSRAEALSGIRNLYPGTPIVRLNIKKWQEQNKKYFECEDIIKALPPVKNTRKVGKWVYDKASQNWRCSVCNETPKTLGYVGTSDFMKKEFVFCNHCGAEMVGAENE